jgi:hypothetical protein
MKLAYVIKEWHGQDSKRWELHKVVRCRHWLIFRGFRTELLSTHDTEQAAQATLKSMAAGWYTETDYDAQGRQINYGW